MKADKDVETYFASFGVHMTTYRVQKKTEKKIRLSMWLHYLNCNQTESVSAWMKTADRIMMW